MKSRISNTLVRAAAICVLSWGMADGAWAQFNGRPDDARGLVQKVGYDLDRAARHARRSDRERERFDNARKHLSDFDRNLRRGKFDKDRLDEAIDDVKNVVEHNTLEPRDRDVLAGDLANLRSMRETRGH